jgi:hypothetical protein
VKERGRGLPRELWSAHDLGSRAPFRTLAATRRSGAAALHADSAASAAVSEAANDPTLPLALSELWHLRRLGLFDDDGRTPPSWCDG